MSLSEQGDVHQALIVLQKGVAQCFPDDRPLTDDRSLHTKGKAMLLVGRLMEETANFESNAIMKTYKVKAFFCFSKGNKAICIKINHYYQLICLSLPYFFLFGRKSVCDFINPMFLF